MTAALLVIALSIAIPDKLRLPSVGMVGLDEAGAAAVIARQIAPPPTVGPAPVRKLRFRGQRALVCSGLQFVPRVCKN
jgi:hypothetical protein